MTRLRIGIGLALLGSVGLGAVFGFIVHRLFLSNVPQQWLSSFQADVSPFTFIGTGLLLGLVIGVWSLLVAWVAPSFRSKPKDCARPAGSDVRGA